MSSVTLAGSVLTGSKAVGLELFGVMQLAYFDLMTQDSLDFYSSTLAEFGSFNGAKLPKPVSSSRSASNNNVLEQMQMDTFFYGNFNLMFFVLLGSLGLALIVLLIAKISHVRLIKKIAVYLLYEIFLSIVLFTTYDIAFSAGIHWQYADPSSLQYVYSSLVLYSSFLLLLFVLLLFFCADPKSFGEFKKMFKRDPASQLYIPLTIIYKITLGLYISLTLDDPVTVLMLAFALAFLMYNLINLPYRNPLHNYRACITHISQFIILIVSNYSKSQSGAPISEKSHSYLPSLMILVCRAISLIFSVLLIPYEVYRLIKKMKFYLKKK